MNSRERVQAAISHKQPDCIPVDFGGTTVTGIHVLTIEKLREYYGLEKRMIKVVEPYQMLGEVDNELKDILGIDIEPVLARNTMFGYAQTDNLKPFKTFWGQEVLMSTDFNSKIDENGDLIVYPGGDTTAPPSCKMPQSSYFFDTIIRQQPINEDSLDPMDNMEEFKPIKDEDIAYYKHKVETAHSTGRAIVANFGGTALGDIALVPAPFLKYPKGIRDIEEWYMSTLMRPDYVTAIFEMQTDIAIDNLKKMYEAVGNKVDVLFICGTDFGTQDSQFCDAATFESLYLPYYRKINDWIHQNTTWKTFKHSCGAVEPLLNSFINAGFDIINPVQINAAGMDSEMLKRKYGNQLTFWGGGVDTQKVLSFGTPTDVTKQVLEQCEILSKNGGFIFNTVHNTQANVPIKNFVAMIEAFKKFNSR